MGAQSEIKNELMLARNKPTLFNESRSERVQMKSLEWFEIWTVSNERLKQLR